MNQFSEKKKEYVPTKKEGRMNEYRWMVNRQPFIHVKANFMAVSPLNPSLVSHPKARNSEKMAKFCPRISHRPWSAECPLHPQFSHFEFNFGHYRVQKPNFRFISLRHLHIWKWEINISLIVSRLFSNTNHLKFDIHSWLVLCVSGAWQSG